MGIFGPNKSICEAGAWSGMGIGLVWCPHGMGGKTLYRHLQEMQMGSRLELELLVSMSSVVILGDPSPAAGVSLQQDIVWAFVAALGAVLQLTQDQWSVAAQPVVRRHSEASLYRKVPGASNLRLKSHLSVSHKAWFALLDAVMFYTVPKACMFSLRKEQNHLLLHHHQSRADITGRFFYFIWFLLSGKLQRCPWVHGAPSSLSISVRVTSKWGEAFAIHLLWMLTLHTSKPGPSFESCAGPDKQ